MVTAETDPVTETDTLDNEDMATLSDEEIVKKLSESQAGDDDYDGGEEPAGDAGDQLQAPEVEEEVVAVEEPPLILGKYKTMEDAEKGQKELEALLARQAQELGDLRKRPRVDTPAPPREEEVITDEMINQAAYEDLNLPKAMELYSKRAKQAEMKAAAEVRADQVYAEALQDAHNQLSKEIDGFWDNEKQVAGPTAIAIRDYALKNGYTDQDLEKVGYDPVNGPKVVRSIHRDMIRDREIEELKKTTANEIEALKKSAGDVAKKIVKTVNSGPKIMGTGAGSGDYSDIPTHLSDAQISEMNDDELIKYLNKTRIEL